MRRLHDEIDRWLRTERSSEAIADTVVEQKKYINDCTKVIMDGLIPQPCVTHQRLVSARTIEEREHIKEMEDEAEGIAKKIAAENGIYPGRIKTFISHQDVMKYTERSEDEAEEDRLEAVQIDVSEEEFAPPVKAAAKSNASILGGLIDKVLLVFNVYYVPSRNEEGVANREAVIKRGFKGFASRYFPVHGMPCGCEEGRHMCQLFRESNGLLEVARLAGEPKYICRKCGRVARSAEHLCDGVAMEVDTTGGA